MAVLWQISYRGVAKSLREWGVDKCVVKTTTEAAGEMVLSAKPESGTAAPLFAHRETITLLRDGVKWFVGPLISWKWTENGRQRRVEYRVADPMWYLENIVYQQSRYYLRDPRDPATGYSHAVSSSGTVLFQGDDATPLNTGGMAAAIFDFAKNLLADAANPGSFLIARGSFDIDWLVPFEKGIDLSCAEALRRCIRWTRDAVTWWDFTAAVPTLHIGRRADLAAVDLDLADEDQITEFEIAPRNDLVPSGVRLNFLRNEVDSFGNVWAFVTDLGAGDDRGGLGCIVKTFQLSGAGTVAEEVPSGLAASFYASLSTLQWEGSITLAGVECVGSVRVGNVVNLLSGNTDWATMRALVQNVSEDIINGETRIEFGPSGPLGLTDFIELLSAGGRGSSAGASPTSRFDGTPDNHPDTPPVPPPRPDTPAPSAPSEGGPPASRYNGTMDIQICDGGVARTITVLIIPKS